MAKKPRRTAPAKPKTRETSPAPRGVYKTANARAELERTIDLAHTRRRLQNLYLDSRPDLAGPSPDGNSSRLLSQDYSTGDKAKAKARQRSQLTLAEGPEKKIERDGPCKARPNDTAGNGSSRDFVPWCKK